MNNTQKEYFRGRLENERAVISARLKEHGARAVGSDSENLDPLQEAEEFAELVTKDALVESEQGLLEKIDLALRRIRDGSYGRCLKCTESIPIDRLDAKPSASLCIKCQSNKEAAASI